MNTAEAKHALDLFGSSVVYVAVQDRETSESGIGTAFHIGDGYFATARHVVEAKDIVGIGRPDISQRTHFVQRPAVFHRTTTHPGFATSVASIDPFFHPDDKVDLAVFRFQSKKVPEARIQFLSDQISEGELLLQDVLVLGFPPIAQSAEPSFVALRAEISSVITCYSDSLRYLVLSGMARGGFSGGPVIGCYESWSVLGIVSKALLRQDQAIELGFIGALTPLPLFELLLHHKIAVRSLNESMQQAKEVLTRRRTERGKRAPDSSGSTSQA